LLVHRRADDSVEHLLVRDLPGLLEQGDLLVRNNTAVLQARLIGSRARQKDGRGGGRVEGLFVEATDEGLWRVLLSAGGRLLEGEVLSFGGMLRLELVSKQGHQWLARPNCSEAPALVLDKVGRTPLPPYIVKARAHCGDVVDDAQDRDWYRTLFADPALRSSVAAPTAGLHLTPEVDASLGRRGVDVANITLHVGEGTFRGIDTDTLEAHAMHSERYLVDADAMTMLRRPRKGRLIAVGTTTARLLESLPLDLPQGGCAGSTDLLISPGHAWRRVEGLLTNFHLPRSTLLALVGALISMKRLHALYALAMERSYRFYSYGDAMLLLP
jgi:S-adenosylmethionine:tRNA ribosyltransferase-isomerase